MAVWTVWEHDRFYKDKAERAVFVRDGFSWSALIFGPLWLLHNGMLLLFIAFVVVVAGLIGAVSEFVSPIVAAPLVPGLGLWFAFEARALRRWSLARRGWRMTGIVEARTRREAEHRYFDDRLHPSWPLAPRQSGAQQPIKALAVGPWGVA